MNAPNTPSEISQLIHRHDGYTEGADPRSIPAATLPAAGHKPGSMLHVIREKCLDCYCGRRSAALHRALLRIMTVPPGLESVPAGSHQCWQFRFKNPRR